MSELVPGGGKQDPKAFSVDLTNCDREPIHQLGLVQTFGFLVVTSIDGHISNVSENIGDFTDLSPDLCLGRPLAALVSEEGLNAIRDGLQNLQNHPGVERVRNLLLADGGAPFDVSVHFSGNSIILEFEPSAVGLDSDELVTNVRACMHRLGAARDQDRFFADAARYMRDLIGFDRVMVYRFLPDGCGEVIAEDRNPELEPFLHLRYPASDIPKQARALYLKNPIRIISDAAKAGSPMVPPTTPSGYPLDMSQCMLRSVSPIHLEYLANMGVAASLSVSIIVRGELWGLIACHHRQPVVLAQSTRLATDLFGQMFSLILEGRLSAEETVDDDRVLSLTNSFASSASSDNLTHRLMMVLDEFIDVLGADGVALVLEGKVLLSGATPTQEEVIHITRFLNRTVGTEIFETNEIGKVFESGRDFVARAAGMLAIPISKSPRDYIVFFRREVTKTVNWAGNPEKPVTVGPNGIRLTPRKSFESWQASVEGQSEIWTPASVRAAGQLRLALLEIVLRLTDEVARERKAAQEKQELLIAELNHRVRNILGLVKGIVSHSRSAEISSDEYFGIVDSRLQAMARAHDQITEKNWSAASLQKLITVEAESYLTDKADRLLIDGEDFNLEPDAFSTVALVVHELMTNSMKYGALADRSGQVKIALSTKDSGDLELTWREVGGPAVKSPKRKGFGSTIIERSIPFQLGGKAQVDFRLSGLEAAFEIPAPYVVASADGSRSTVVPVRSNSGKDINPPERVLIVEDVMIIGMAAEDHFRELGSETVSVVSNIAQAREELGREKFDFILLDVNLGRETSFDFAEQLVARAVKFAFATGYGDGAGLTPKLKNIPVITKPYDKDRIAELLERCGFLNRS